MRKILLLSVVLFVVMVMAGCGSGGAGDSGPYYFTVKIEKRNCRSDCTWTARREVEAKVHTGDYRSVPKVTFDVPSSFLTEAEAEKGTDAMFISLTNPFDHTVTWTHHGHTVTSTGELLSKQTRELSFVKNDLYVRGRFIPVDIRAYRHLYFAVYINFSSSNN